jgi:hypothetical protein
MRPSSSIGVTSGTVFKGCGALLLVVALADCEPMARSAVAVDCDAENDIEYFSPNVKENSKTPAFRIAWEDANAVAGTPTADTNFYCFSDPTLDGYPATPPWPSVAGCTLPRMERIENGGFCQQGSNAGTRHQAALHIQAGNHLFWGATFGTWNYATSPIQTAFPDASLPLDAEDNPTTSSADGIAFWVRKSPGSDSTVSIYLTDETTTSTATTAADALIAACITEQSTDASQQQGQAAASDPNLQTNNSAITLVHDSRACGNRWRTELTVSEDWQLIKVPWGAFYKELIQPNMKTLPFNPKELYSIQIVLNRGQFLSVWFDEVGLYREKK